MKTITIPGNELYDEETNKFITTKTQTIVIEHSLVSISKWESKWKKPFIREEQMTIPELQDYVRCMTLTQNVNPDIYKGLPTTTLNEIVEYMNDTMTATWFSNPDKTGKKGEVVTSELVYYWMTALNIPMECQKWHFNRLMTLIRIAGEKNQPPKKMNKNDIYKQNRALNAKRRAARRSRG